MNQTGTPISVIGGGVMGLSIAHLLSRLYPDVTLYDPEIISARRNASTMAGGMLAPYSEIEYMPPEFIPAALEGIRSWGKILPPAMIQKNGTLVVAHEQDEYLFTRLTGKLQAFPVSEFLDQKNLKQKEPELTKFNHALYIGSEAHLEPKIALDFLQTEVNNYRAERFDMENSSSAGWIIDCRGYDATSNENGLRGVKGEAIMVRNLEFSLQRPVRLMHPRYPIYIVPRSDHVFMIGATIIESAQGDHVGIKSALELLSAAFSLHPSFADAEILEIYSGIRPAYPDNLPRISIKNNVISCNGLFRHGFLLAPVMAQCVADYIAGKENLFMPLFRKDQNDHTSQRTEHNNLRRA